MTIDAATGTLTRAADLTAAATVARFLDTAAAATGRATFYNSADEQRTAELAAHAGLAALDRALYTGLVGSPYMLDRARQTGALHLLSTPGGAPGEGEAIRRIVGQLSVPRMLNLYGMLAEQRVNNARARKLVLRTLLGAPAFGKWAVRYRRKLAAALRHAWGARTAGIVRAVLVRELAGEELDAKELRILASEIDRHAPGRDRAVLHESVAFVLGAAGPFRQPLLRAYAEARTDLDAGRTLPYETLEGLRGRFHSAEPHARVLELTKSRLTAGQRLGMQAQAEKAGVEVEVDFARYDAVRLYVYAYERGMSDDVAQALAARARTAAAALDLADRRIALVLDGSASMAGAREQALRPVAATLALRDVLREAAAETAEVWFGARPDADGLVRPAGASGPAEALIEALSGLPDLVVVVSDGYENAPAGRFAEVLAAARDLGITTPVVQFNPVAAAEASGVRALSPDVPVAGVQRVAGLEFAFCRMLLDADPAAALRGLARLAGLPAGSVRNLLGPDREDVAAAENAENAENRKSCENAENAENAENSKNTASAEKEVAT
ncbi:hypothetical protein [Yinghuangia soli]|uniref:VWA domain-containing protein n=1 Tax=Yinghuangia soli TaxID=2908204 RepID=A0AA41Q3G5_9ACTN|nr:hypothetical protein [Yinghuangia soli]MCF2529407.1 hypothetical protein [Yinghuangia soli]